MPAHNGYISWSELNTFRRCPHQWFLAYVVRLSVPRVGGAANLGTEWHKLLEQWFQAQKDGENPRKAAKVLTGLVQHNLDHAESEVLRTQWKTLAWMWEGWQEEGHREFDGWKVLTLEASEYVPLDSMFRLKVKKDMLAADRRGRLWVIDHKSTAKHTKPNETDLSFDDQAALYMLGELMRGTKTRGALWNYAVTKDTKAGRSMEERFWTVRQNRTLHELETVRVEALADCRRMAEIRTLHEATRRPDKEYCRWLCDFRSACLLARRGEIRDEVQGVIDMGGEIYVPPVKPALDEAETPVVQLSPIPTSSQQ